MPFRCLSVSRPLLSSSCWMHSQFPIPPNSWPSKHYSLHSIRIEILPHGAEEEGDNMRIEIEPCCHLANPSIPFLSSAQLEIVLSSRSSLLLLPSPNPPSWTRLKLYHRIHSLSLPYCKKEKEKVHSS